MKHLRMPIEPTVVKSIVTTDMVYKVADYYRAKVINVLTGFKYIGEQILYLEKQGKENSYIFGFEESYGYLSGGYVRDKDAVDGAFLIVEMFAYYKTRNISLLQKLDELYHRFGYYSDYLNSYQFEGSSGFKKMQQIMAKFRKIKSFGEYKINWVNDYEKGVNGLPKSNVLQMYLSDDISLVIRPSGTEPKLKIYISIKGSSLEENNKKYKAFIEKISEVLQ